jgi:hypothetical protein
LSVDRKAQAVIAIAALLIMRGERGDWVQPECPEPERLALYLEHGCSERERREIETHLADCRDCRRIIALVVKSKAAVPDIEVKAKSKN